MMQDMRFEMGLTMFRAENSGTAEDEGPAGAFFADLDAAGLAAFALVFLASCSSSSFLVGRLNPYKKYLVIYIQLIIRPSFTDNKRSRSALAAAAFSAFSFLLA
ncbi:hypothetical protein PGT21_034357 [Puccinia graminis f. sp. tritici]|uniref:Uncharacterized protein n=1 Tax=Puccinia graminis f. sp. tritici TaxID=56615 RepID=A0A5B0LQF6_PUCGR|nr:hypothetical protein PGT21_034357 [Puccinia graminis f. sp. tritici]